jgi:hypothetical protein
MKKKPFSSLICCALLAVYLLGIHEGKIALWKGNDPEPIKVFDYEASKLPEDAQKQLQAGVPIKSIKQLRELAEQYLP